jgi:amino acid transporter
MARAQKFGTFGGVFVPSVLTILGVIMYLRLGWVVGNSGLVGAIIIILIAHVISITTGLSVSSIATDKKVKAGGIYYMLSRSLGLPIGGSIGIALFVATALSIAMYIVGFAESFNSVIGLNTVEMEAVDRVNNLRITGTITLIVVCTIALVSTSLAIKTQYYILCAIALSIISIFAGGLFLEHDFSPTSRPLFAVPGSASMETVFAIFFPAVTGFTAGVAMSGDLKDPKKSIPFGTMAAIGVGLLVYISLAVFLSATVDSSVLMEDTNILSKIALFSAYGAPFLMAGIWGATLSSALGGILGGPRILQAMSLDKVTPNIFAKGVGKSNEPRNALIFAFFIAEAGILIGELDLIAPIVSMFYLTAYGFINLTCALESWSGSDFRPSFNIPRSISWLGAIATFAVMFKLDMLAMFAAFIVIGLIFLYLTRKQISMGFSDVWQGVWSEVVRLALSRIRQSESDRRSWRPNIILFSGSTERRPHLLEYGTNLVGRLGLMSNFDLVEDKNTEVAFAKRDQAIDSDDQNRGVFTRRYSCYDIYSGIERIAETYGFSGLDPNTILMGWARYTKDPVKFSQLINKFQLLDYSLLIMDYDQRVGFGKKKRIDIWSSRGGRHLTFALTISRFLNTSDDWQDAQIRLNILADTSRVDDMIIHQKLDQVQEELRVGFELRILNTALLQRSYYEVVRYESAEADMVYLELPDLKEGAEKAFFQQTDELCKEIGTVILYKGSSEFGEIDLGLKDSSLENLTQQDTTDLNYASLPSAVIPDLKLPADPVMASSLEQIEKVNRQLIRNYFQEFLIPFANKQVHFVESMQALTSQFYASLNGENVDKGTLPNSISKKEKAMLGSALEQVAEYGENSLQLQAQTLRASIEFLDSSIDGIVAKSPLEVAVDYSKEDLDQTLLNRFPWRQRIQALFGKSTLSYQLAYQQLVAVQFGLHFKKALLAVHQQINQNTAQFASDFRKSLRRLTAGIRNLTSAEDPDTLATRIREEAQQIKDRLYDLESKTGTQINAYRDFLFSESISRFQKVAVDMDSLRVNSEAASLFKTHKKWNQLDTQMEELIAAWGYNQPLELNLSELEIKLLLLQIDLENALKQLLYKFHTLPQRKVVQPSEKLRASLVRLIEQVKQGKYLQTIGTHEPADLSELTETIRNFIATSRELTTILPEKLTVPNLEGLSADNYEEFESIEISPRDVAGHFIQSNIVAQLESFSGQLQTVLSKADHTILDVMQVTRLALDDLDSEQAREEAAGRLITTIQGEIARIDDSIQSVEELLENQTHKLHESYAAVSQDLSARAVIKSALDFDYYLMTQKQTQVINKFTSFSQNTKNYIQAGLTKLYYRRSEGVIAAKRFRVQKDYWGNWATSTSKMISEISPDNLVIQDLPFYYKQLFLRPHSVAKDLWLLREYDVQEADESVSFHRRVRSGGLLILGAPMSGKSYLSNFIAQRHFDSDRCFSIMPPEQGSIEIKDFHRAIKKGLKYYGEIQTTFDQLPDHAVLEFHDAEKWWERSEQGYAVLTELMDLIERYGRQTLFIVNMNWHSFHLINDIGGIEERFFKVIKTQPFNAEELKQVILSRHRTSRIKFRLQGNHEDSLSDWKLAKLFTRYFDLSEGNVGVALQQWICHIERISEQGEIMMRVPKRPDREVLNSLGKDRLILLIQFVLHKQLSSDRLSRIMQMEEEELSRQIEVLHRMDILRGKNGVWEINRYLLPFLIQTMEEELLL